MNGQVPHSVEFSSFYSYFVFHNKNLSKIPLARVPPVKSRFDSHTIEQVILSLYVQQAYVFLNS